MVKIKGKHVYKNAQAAKKQLKITSNIFGWKKKYENNLLKYLKKKKKGTTESRKVLSLCWYSLCFCISIGAMLMSILNSR